MAFKPAPVAFGPYSQWRHAFDNEKVYTRRDMANAMHEKDNACAAAMQILGVKQLLPNDYELMMQIIRVERSPEGIFIVVR